MPEPRSTRVPGSGTKCRFRKPKPGTTADAPMFVLMKIGVTRVTLPDGAPVFDSGDTPPMAVIVPIWPVPVVHGAPITVMFTAAITVTTPPWPTTFSGTFRFEMLADEPHAP